MQYLSAGQSTVYCLSWVKTGVLLQISSVALGSCCTREPSYTESSFSCNCVPLLSIWFMLMSEYRSACLVKIHVCISKRKCQSVWAAQHTHTPKRGKRGAWVQDKNETEGGNEKNSALSNSKYSFVEMLTVFHDCHFNSRLMQTRGCVCWQI